MATIQRLWYKEAARHWTDALPIGNGRIGGMVFGGIHKETLSLNEDSLWSGYPRNTSIDGAAAYFRKSQQMIKEKRYAETQRFIEDHMLGHYTESYLPLCDLHFEFDGISEAHNYSRSLTLMDGIARTEFTEGGAQHLREAFVSFPDQALIFRLSSDHPGRISFRMGYGCQLHHTVSATAGSLILSGVAPSGVLPVYLDDPDPVVYEEDENKRGMRFFGIATVEAKGGTVRGENQSIFIEGADEVVVRFTARTSFNGFDKQPYTQGRDERALCEADTTAAANKAFQTILNDHIADHSALYDRVSFSLTSGGDYENQTTSERLRNFAHQQDDQKLIELIFHFGRYLLIAASRPSSQPMNLQGIWNHHLRAPWSSNYTVNINTEMNYWPAEMLGLPELHEPLFRLIDELMITGSQTAKLHYGARGAVAHHNVDIWRLSNPVGYQRRGAALYAFWPMSFGWLCEHLYEHYRFTQDEAFLEGRALPAIRAAARFFLDIIAENSAGYLSITPATSPENNFIIYGEPCAVAEASTMNNAILREVFENYLSALKTLGRSEAMEDEVRRLLPRLHPYQIGSKGQLLEWDTEFEEAEPHHRHVSHLYGLHPSRQITPETTPELTKACIRTLEMRGDDGTGWSLGWKINFWARLKDGDHALRLIKTQLRFVEGTDETNYSQGGGTYANLFDAHPPFQIDGNFGTCSGIAEMLLQSNNDEITLLPALPGEWRGGSVTGLCAHGGLSVDVHFADGRLQKAVIRRVSGSKKPVRVMCKGGERILNIAPGESVELAYE